MKQKQTKKQWNHFLRTPICNGRFRLPQRKAPIFSLNLTCLIWTVVNIRTMETFLCPESQTPIYC